MSSRKDFETWGCSDRDLSITLKCETYSGIAWLAWKAATSAMEAKCAALAAENAALKSKAAELVHEASEVYSAYNATITEPDGDFMDMQTLQEMQSVETPATDAFLAEVRAQGVEMMVEQCELDFVFIEPEDEEHYTLMIEHAKEFAAQLRQGGAE